jgi:hypothetical protein
MPGKEGEKATFCLFGAGYAILSIEQNVPIFLLFLKLRFRSFHERLTSGKIPKRGAMREVRSDL